MYNVFHNLFATMNQIIAKTNKVSMEYMVNRVNQEFAINDTGGTTSALLLQLEESLD